MHEPSDKNQSEPIETQPKNIDLESEQLKLEKLKLEIENLKPKKKLVEGFVRSIPILTALISIAGLLQGVRVFNLQQEKDRLTREADRISRDQTQYRNSYDQLLQFSSNPNVTVHRVLFLHDDISKLIDSLYPPDKDATDNKAQKEQLKALIFGLITKGDFTQTRHVQLDIAALETWKDYEEEIKVKPNKTYINKYIQAIRYLHTRDPKYIESVTFTPQIGYTETQAPTEPLSNSFQTLVEGFKLHLSLLGPKEKDEAIQEFGVVTNNPTLQADLFPPDPSKLSQ